MTSYITKWSLSGIMARDRRPPPRKEPTGDVAGHLLIEATGTRQDIGGHLLVEATGMREDEKKCPYCDEIIKKAAKKCRFCMEWLTASGRKE
jgi:hypothetical protein